MTTPKFDLTDQIKPFLDPKLFDLVQQFNAEAPAPADKSTSQVDLKTVTLKDAETLYENSQFDDCFQALTHLSSKFDHSSPEYAGIVWGKLASKILSGKDADNGSPGANAKQILENDQDEEPKAVDKQELLEEPLLREVEAVRDLLDSDKTMTALEQLNKKAWLIHWSLFVYFKGYRLGRLIDCFTQSNNMSVIQYACPWVLRYLVVAVVITHNPTTRYNRRIREVVKFVSQESYEYQDPVIKLLQTLYVDCDFSSINTQLAEVTTLLNNDFFAHGFVSMFVESFRVLTADMFFRVHLTVNVKELSNILGLQENDDKWLTRYLGNKSDARLDVSYNEESGVASASLKKPCFTQQVAEKIRAVDSKAQSVR